jgi:hypothetical protein
MKPRSIFWVGAIFFTIFMSLKYSTLSDKDHKSAIKLAAEEGLDDIVRYLHKHGASIGLEGKCFNLHFSNVF